MSVSVAIDEPPPVAAQHPAELEQVVDEEASCYWDASTMARLNAASAAAIARLRAYRPPPFPLWDRLPLSRRAAVLMLLYADRRGDLRVVITMRAASLRSFSGHAALPGGKADSLDETPYQIARREAWEEIGLPMDDAKIPAPFRIEHLCYLPMNLARTELVVRPCVAFLHTTDPPIPTGSITAPSLSSSSSSSTSSSPSRLPASPQASSSPPSLSPSSSPSTTPTSASTTVEESLIPRLDAKEVAAVFSAPFHNFLKATDEVPPSPPQQQQQQQQQDAPSPPPSLPPGIWYEGAWTTWHDSPWRMHFFYVPVHDQRVVRPLPPGKGGKGAKAARRASQMDRAEETVAEKRKAERGEGEEQEEKNLRSGARAVDGKAGDGEREGAEGAITGKGNAGTGREPKEEEGKEEKKDEPATPGRFKVWGMTARMLVDAATIAYGEEPEFEHNAHFGDEKMIEALAATGRLAEKKRPESVGDREGPQKKAGEAVAAAAESEAAGKDGSRNGGGNGGSEGSKM
ncbi:hypothetical protein VTK26DRAFT_6957 [Humicola hyalothermophila]